jgi:hypothetical protein
VRVLPFRYDDSVKRAAIGFVVRLLGAAAFSAIIAWGFFLRFDEIPLPRNIYSRLIQVLNFPVALAGQLVPSIRGFDLLYYDGQWCDFCSLQYMVCRQLLLAIPVYTALLYLPKVLTPIRRSRDPLFVKTVILTLTCASEIAAYFAIRGGADGATAVRLCTLCCLIVAAAAACAWSSLRRSLKVSALAVVIVAGGWASATVALGLNVRVDSAWVWFAGHLALVALEVTGALWITRIAEPYWSQSPHHAT